MVSPESLSAQEQAAAFDRYNKIKHLGKNYYPDRPLHESETVNPEDVATAKEFLALAANEVSPLVWPVYWDHIFVATELGKNLATEAKVHGIEVNPAEIEFLLWFHDLGRLIVPSAYLRNDRVSGRLFHEIGLPKVLVDKIASTEQLMVAAEKMKFTKRQRLGRPLGIRKRKLLEKYFESQTPTQRIMNVADNLGKRDKDGNIFTLEAFYEYLRTQEARYQKTAEEQPLAEKKRTWPSTEWSVPRRQDGAFLQALIVQMEVEWLTQNGVDVSKIIEGLADVKANVESLITDDKIELTLVGDHKGNLFTLYPKKDN